MLKHNSIFIKKTQIKDGTVFLSVNYEAEKVRESKLGTNFQQKVLTNIFSNVLKFKMIFPQINLEKKFKNNHKF